MAIVYNWNCKTVDVHPQEEGEINVVYNVHWILTGTSDRLDPEGNPYQATTIGTQVVPLNHDAEFIPFEDLTNEIIVDWTKESMGEEMVADIEAGVQQIVNLKINPISVTMTIGG